MASSSVFPGRVTNFPLSDPISDNASLALSSFMTALSIDRGLPLLTNFCYANAIGIFVGAQQAAL
jgi:hypothetical protein